MPTGPTIALDAMGGDFGPPVVLKGAEIARERHPEMRFLVFGKGSEVEAELKHYPKLEAVTTALHTDDVVLGTDRPSQALRRSRTSSMGLAIEAVKDGRADVAVSAGNTGALMAMAKFILRAKAGVDRPALVSVLPTRRGESVMLDLGANVDCTADNLVQFAIMGAAFARSVLGLERPRVALLNIGVEDLKGTEELKDAAARLRAGSALPMEFAGFTEGDKIGAGDFDVIVTDGFSGNIALKTAEGTAKLITDLLGQAFRQSWLSKLGYLMARRGLRTMKDYLDPNNHNGAVFLGLGGLVVKSHGSATAAGIATAIGMARELVEDRIAERIERDLAALAAIEPVVVANTGAAVA
jgi:glycerol-3-phosphate acyltransferase PlsX